MVFFGAFRLMMVTNNNYNQSVVLFEEEKNISSIKTRELNMEVEERDDFF